MTTAIEENWAFIVVFVATVGVTASVVFALERWFGHRQLEPLVSPPKVPPSSSDTAPATSPYTSATATYSDGRTETYPINPASSQDTEAIPRFMKYRDGPPKRTVDECWPWTGAKIRGYGYFKVGGPDRKMVRAHRYAWLIAHGSIDPNLTIDHLCKNKACMNVAHMELVTQRVNNDRSPRTVSTVNRGKTHCKHGHEFTDANTYVYYATNYSHGRKTRHRACKTC